MPDTTNGDGSAFNFDRKLDRINDTLASMVGLMHESMQSMQSYMQLTREQHQLFMEEVHSLMELQREQRVDIMALFEGNKQLRLMLDRSLKRPEPKTE